MKRRLLIAGAALLLIGAYLLFGVFEVQALFIDETVNESAPTTSTTLSKTSQTPLNNPNAPLRQGQFRSLEHTTTGEVRLIDTGNSYVVRLVDLDTSNGPDLFVYLSKAPSDSEEQTFNDDFVNLGELKGNKGSQNYDVPPGTNIAEYKSVVVWCKRFSAGFGVAPLL